MVFVWGFLCYCFCLFFHTFLIKNFNLSATWVETVKKRTDLEITHSENTHSCRNTLSSTVLESITNGLTHTLFSAVFGHEANVKNETWGALLNHVKATFVNMKWDGEEMVPKSFPLASFKAQRRRNLPSQAHSNTQCLAAWIDWGEPNGRRVVCDDFLCKFISKTVWFLFLFDSCSAAGATHAQECRLMYCNVLWIKVPTYRFSFYFRKRGAFQPVWNAALTRPFSTFLARGLVFKTFESLCV